MNNSQSSPRKTKTAAKRPGLRAVSLQPLRQAQPAWQADFLAMMRLKQGLCGLLLAFTLLAGFQSANAAPWVTAHYVYWEEGELPPAQIDMTAITHLIYFAALPNKNGTIDFSNLDEAGAVAAAAHNAGELALVCVGGGDQSIYEGFSSSITSTYRATFVKNIVAWVQANGYDGVDVDMEPINNSDASNFVAFIQALSTALKASNANAVLTADIAVEGSAPANAFVPALSCFDQINLETYDLSGNYPGWVTWHDSCIYSNGQTFPSTSGPLPSSDQFIQQWIAAGVPAAKLGVGIDCQGVDWTGATGPEQSINGVTINYRDYNDIITNSYSAAAYHYDTGAKASYLSLANDFITYTDPQLCADKVAYVQSQGLGGLMVWQIEAQIMPNGDQPLLAALATALSGGVTSNPGSIAIQEPVGTSLLNGATVNVGSTPVGSQNQTTVTVVNTGAMPVSNLAISVTGANALAFTAGAPGATTLSAGDSTTFTITFAPTTTGTARANVTVSGDNLASSASIALVGTGVTFFNASGSFAGIFRTNDLLKVTAAGSGAFSATLVLNGQSHSFSGSFGSDLSYNGTIGAAAIPVSLQLAMNGNGAHAGDAMLVGSIGGNAVTAYHAAYLSGQKAAEAGRYTVFMAPTDSSSDIPQGVGCAILSVATTGGATLIGHLADGSALSVSGALVGGGSGSNQFIVYANNSQFLLLGSLSFTGNRQIGGALAWNRNASTSHYYGSGFSTNLQLAGSLYVPPKTGVMALSFAAGTGNATISINGAGAIVGGIAATLTPKNQVIISGNNFLDLKLSINPATGAFSGSFFDSAANKNIAFAGLLNQGAASPYAAGYFLSPVLGGVGFSGSVELSQF